MSDLEDALKSEISRLARKAVRAELEPYKAAAAMSKAQITQLRAATVSMQKQINHLTKLVTRIAPPPPTPAAETEGRHRFTAKGFASMREKLAISSAEMGRLIGASGQSVGKWESGENVPRQKYQERIFALRGKGKRDIQAMLAAT